MILELSEPIPTTDTIKYAKLGSQPAAGERVKTVGWYVLRILFHQSS